MKSLENKKMKARSNQNSFTKYKFLDLSRKTKLDFRKPLLNTLS
jgi:hypothetical protein